MNRDLRSETTDESAFVPAKLNEFLVVNQNIEPCLASGCGAEVRDEQGRAYIDLEAGPGVASVGHCHPKVVQAIKDQADRLLQVPGRYHSVRTMSLAERISELTGGRLRRTFFANSGAESADGAIKCSLKHAANSGKKGFGIPTAAWNVLGDDESFELGVLRHYLGDSMQSLRRSA